MEAKTHFSFLLLSSIYRRGVHHYIYILKMTHINPHTNPYAHHGDSNSMRTRQNLMFAIFNNVY